MKKIGILGGLAWPSTVEYYAGICRLAEERHTALKSPGAPATPEMAIESLDIVKAASLLGDDRDEASWAAFDAYHRDGLRRLERSGSDLAIIACNTAHHRFVQITCDVRIPVLSILDVAAAACRRNNFTRVLVVGTSQVMQSAYFRAVFAQHGIEAASPRSLRGRRKIFTTIDALQNGRIAGAAQRIQAAVAETGVGRLRRPTAVYLGCTELPLAFPAHKNAGVFESDGIRYINSTALHISAAFGHAIEEP